MLDRKNEDQENLLYLIPTSIIDSDHQKHSGLCSCKLLEKAWTLSISAVKLYLAVRDGIRYDPYTPFYLPEHYRASLVLRRGRGFCVPKASLLCALGRACWNPFPCRFCNRPESSRHKAAHRLHWKRPLCLPWFCRILSAKENG